LIAGTANGTAMPGAAGGTVGSEGLQEFSISVAAKIRIAAKISSAWLPYREGSEVNRLVDAGNFD
jgi:hypothetical protein